MTQQEAAAIDALLRRLAERKEELDGEVVEDSTPTIQIPVRQEVE